MHFLKVGNIHWHKNFTEGTNKCNFYYTVITDFSGTRVSIFKVVCICVLVLFTPKMAT
jgi:hypothetical protein